HGLGRVDAELLMSVQPAQLDVESLRRAIRLEYEEVAQHPELGFHFLVGRPLAAVLGYDPAWLRGIPEASIEWFAGTGNPFGVRLLSSGERVVDIGSGAGIDSLIAARMVAPAGRVIGVDMTPAMLAKARGAAAEAAIANVEFRDGTAEALPIDNE